jgi:hypothetical protein
LKAGFSFLHALMNKHTYPWKTCALYSARDKMYLSCYNTGLDRETVWLKSVRERWQGLGHAVRAYARAMDACTTPQDSDSVYRWHKWVEVTFKIKGLPIRTRRTLQA